MNMCIENFFQNRPCKNKTKIYINIFKILFLALNLRIIRLRPTAILNNRRACIRFQRPDGQRYRLRACYYIQHAEKPHKIVINT